MSEHKFKYIFVTGAPGSKWSSVARTMWYSPEVDRSDDKKEYSDGNVRHQGAYWGPGMEYGNDFAAMNLSSKEDLEKEFDRPFSGKGVRIIKSHDFANHLEFIRKRNKVGVGVLMMSHMNDIPGLISQARLMQEYGASGVILMDSAGYFLPNDVHERVEARFQPRGLPGRSRAGHPRQRRGVARRRRRRSPV